MPKVSQLAWTQPSNLLRVLLHNYRAICEMFYVLLSLPGKSRTKVGGRVCVSRWGVYGGVETLEGVIVSSTPLSHPSGRQTLNCTWTDVPTPMPFVNPSAWTFPSLCMSHS